MQLNRKLIFPLLGSLFYACAPQGGGEPWETTSVSSKGAIVYYLKTPEQRNIHCEGGRVSSKHNYITELYISKNNIKGSRDLKLQPSDRDVIYYAVQSYLTDSQYINPITNLDNPQWQNLFPTLKITVQKFVVDKGVQNGKAYERVYFAAGMSITKTQLEELLKSKQLKEEFKKLTGKDLSDASKEEVLTFLASRAGKLTVTCHATQVEGEAEDVKPQYKSYELKPVEKLKITAVKRAVEKMIKNFTPERVETFRPVREGNKYAKILANAIDAGNYDTAIKFGESYLRNPKLKNNYDLIYNLAVAYEAKAWKAPTLEESIKLLEKAKELYEKAIEVAASKGIDAKDANTADGQVSQSLTHLKELQRLNKEYKLLLEAPQKLLEFEVSTEY